MAERYDAVVVGAGPNGLAAAVRLARAGRSVLVLEGADTVGGGCRTAELTLPGYRHDVCSAIHPLAAGSPFLTELDLGRHGLEWIHPDAPLAHPLDDGPAVMVERSLDATVDGLDGTDRRAWRDTFEPFLHRWEELRTSFLGPVVRIPEHPLVMARFGLVALQPASVLARRFDGARARALLAGSAAHSFLPMKYPITAAFGVFLPLAGHAVGWPMPRGGSQAIVDALAADLVEHGGEIRTGQWVRSLEDVPPATDVLLDLQPEQVLRMAGGDLPARVRNGLIRFRRGPGVFKIDYALSGPVPWKAEGAERAGTVHLGGTFEEIATAESDVAAGRPPTHPFVLTAQQSRFDTTRAPDGSHTLWAYCHVPNGSTVDMTEAIENQIERFAPGFRDLVLERHVMGPSDFESYNPNDLGGDISGGAHTGLQFVFRPRFTFDPYRLRLDGRGPGLWLCSSSTPPGGGVHGMCGYHAAGSVLRVRDRGGA